MFQTRHVSFTTTLSRERTFVHTVLARVTKMCFCFSLGRLRPVFARVLRVTERTVQQDTIVMYARKYQI